MRDTDEPTHRSVDELARAPCRSASSDNGVGAGFSSAGREGARGGVQRRDRGDGRRRRGARAVGRADPRNYRDPAIGAVGGRCINISGKRSSEVPDTDVVGRVTRVGTFVGNMYKRPTFSDPVDVDFMIGGCMSFRRRSHEARVRHGAQSQRRPRVRSGSRASGQSAGTAHRFRSAIAIRHYSAPRKIPACARSTTRKGCAGRRTTTRAWRCDGSRWREKPSRSAT